jgi:AcrR family transcriptional regulator
MRNTKEKIQDAAQLLFNQHGYFNVTIRMIAQELNMSSGNLNYHFKTRKELLKKLYFDMVEVFDKRVDNIQEQNLSLQFISDSMETSMERMVAYKFFWTDLDGILREEEEIRIHFHKAYQRRLAGSKFLFQTLIAEKKMRLPLFEKEYDFLAIRMINFSDAWLNTLALYRKKKIAKSVSNQRDILFGMLFPYLTKKGQREFQKVAAHLF